MCAQVCHVSIPLHHVWEANREFLINQGIPPLAPHKEMMGSLDSDNNPWGQPGRGRAEWLGERKVAPTGDVLYFVGCSESYVQMAAAEAGAALLDTSNMDWTTLGREEWCCGNAESKIGVTDHLDERARHNVDAIEATGATRVVSGCPGCVLTLGSIYPDRGMGGDFETLHIVELLAELIEGGDLAPRKGPKGRVIWHDPCELGRVGSKVYSAPRQILDAVCGKGEWLEFTQNRDLGECCGGGGAFKGVDDDAALRIGGRKIEEGSELGADILVTACPTCRFNFNHATQKVKRDRKEDGDGTFKMRVMDIKELILRSL
jgi:glycolate oxidase